MVGFSQTIDKVNASIKAMNVVKGYIFYFYDIENLNCNFHLIYDLQSIAELKKYNETFYLDKPSFMLEGKPVFIVCRHNPISLKFNKLEENQLKKGNDYPIALKIENEKERIKMKESGYTSEEINAKIHSVYTTNIFRKSYLSSNIIIVFFLSLLLAVLLTYIVCQSVLEPIRIIEYVDNSTISNTTRYLMR